MNKLLIICGPTATGKTALAIKLAKKFGGEIISADSRQVYKGMDIGTGKDLPENSKLKTQNSKLQIKDKNFQVGYYLFGKIPVWLYDVTEPDQEFSAANFYDLAWWVIEDVWQRKKIPFLVGGTGFYIKAVIDGVESLGIEPDWKLRKKLSNLDIKKLREILEKTCPERMRRMNESERQNPRRLIRAIEIAEWKKKQSNYDTVLYHSKRHDFRHLFIGLTASYKVLYQKIDKRVEERVKMGVEQEMRKLLTQGYSRDLPAMSAHGYGEWRQYFEGKTTLTETLQRWKWNEHGYARRQLTWFKKDRRIHWLDICQSNWERKVEQLCKRWYTTK